METSPWTWKRYGMRQLIFTALVIGWKPAHYWLIGGASLHGPTMCNCWWLKSCTRFLRCINPKNPINNGKFQLPTKSQLTGGCRDSWVINRKWPHGTLARRRRHTTVHEVPRTSLAAGEPRQLRRPRSRQQKTDAWLSWWKFDEPICMDVSKKITKK